MKNNNRTKKIIRQSLFLKICFFSITAFSQQFYDDAARAIAKNGSPETAVRNNAKYSNVDMFRGTVTTSIPIDIYKGREKDLPISIDYITTGVKVDQVASNVGLGWNLSLGGRITRIVTKVADDKFSRNPNTACVMHEDRVIENNDFYKVNAPGFEDIFKYTYSQTKFKSLKNPKNIIQRIDNPGQDEWKGDGEYMITATDGTKYYFGQNNSKEKSFSVFNFFPFPGAICSDVDIESTTSLMLTKIVSKNNLDEYVFNYSAFEWETPITYDGEGYAAYVSLYNAYYFRPNVNSYRVKQQMLSSVYHNGEPIIVLNYQNRSDLDFVNSGNALSQILFLKHKELSPYKKVGFNYSYFGQSNATNPHFTDQRLKLDDITFYGFNGSNAIAGDTYHMDYISPEKVPPITSSDRDFMGLYNKPDNRSANITLVYYCLSPTANLRRSYLFEKSIIGTLDKITYPGKGYTKFEFERNALVGGFGHDTIPEQTGTLYDKEVLAYASPGSQYMTCGYPSVNQTIPHPLMTTPGFSFANFPNSSIYDGVTEALYFKDARTMLLRIDDSTGNNIHIDTNGIGAYLIQKVEACGDRDSDIPIECEGNLGILPEPYNECLRNTSEIFNVGNSYSQASDYIMGGLTDGTSNLTTHYLELGTYQVTVWAYAFGGEDSIGATVDIYKLNPRPIIVQPQQIINSDQTSNFVDGFRVKSITNYNPGGVFASKTAYKYAEGYMVDKVENVRVTDPDIFWETTWVSSRGYPNSEIINYPKVFEVALNSDNEDNGSIEYIFNKAQVPNYENYADRAIIPFFYNNGAEEQTTVNYIDGQFGTLKQKNIYNKAEKLLERDSYQYENLPFDVGCYICGPFNGPDIHYYIVPKKLTHSFYTEGFPTPLITKEDLIYTDLDLWYKVKNDDTSDYEYEYYEYDSQNRLIQLDNWQADTKFIYSLFSGRSLLNEIQQLHDYDYVTRVKNSYDTDGNLIETVRFTPGTLTGASYESYLYGYSNRFQVAKIMGLPYSQISASRIANIKGLSDVPVNASNEQQLRNELKLLRGDFPNALVTTYTYNPSFGVTSVTDPKGYTIYYDYDAFGRLQFTKQQNDTGTGFEILSENQYHTRQ